MMLTGEASLGRRAWPPAWRQRFRHMARADDRGGRVGPHAGGTTASTGVTDLWSRVQEASRRYSTSTGDSELASLEESLGANLTRMRRYEDRAALSYTESEQWSEQAAAVRSDAQAIEARAGAAVLRVARRTRGHGRKADRRGQGHAARVAPDPGGRRGAARTRGRVHPPSGSRRRPGPIPRPSPEGGCSRRRGEDFGQAHGPAAGTAHAGWAAGVRERAAGAGAPGPGDAGEGARSRPRGGRGRARRPRGGSRCQCPGDGRGNGQGSRRRGGGAWPAVP